MNLKPYIIPGLILIILVLCFVSLRQCEKAKELVSADDKTELLQEVAEKRARIAQQDSAIQRSIEKRNTDSVKFEGLKTRLIASTAFWKEKALKARPLVVVMSDSIPVLKAYIEATDSVIAKQDSTIQIQALHITSQAKLYEDEIAVMAARHIKQIELTEIWKNAYTKEAEKAKKANRRKKFWRAVAMVFASATAITILAN